MRRTMRNLILIVSLIIAVLSVLAIMKYNQDKAKPEILSQEEKILREEERIENEEYLNRVVENLKLYQEEDKYYIEYKPTELPEGIEEEIDFELVQLEGKNPTILKTGRGFVKSQRVDKDSGFIEEMKDLETLEDIEYINIKISIKRSSSKYDLAYNIVYTPRDESYMHKYIRGERQPKPVDYDLDQIFTWENK